ncbi:hypothetical protein BpHYR1_042438 [Brachionus plicatilis]|uniref:Uncharacterized protein n=1 Tax=Brachionus plicatilis TaxID=10195 RepID=A0A3M7QWC4_BRAPC|nr:hypothetical protein BpHYR1_042438 [Brachionus plicatilis]
MHFLNGSSPKSLPSVLLKPFPMSSTEFLLETWENKNCGKDKTMAIIQIRVRTRGMLKMVRNKSLRERLATKMSISFI